MQIRQFMLQNNYQELPGPSKMSTREIVKLIQKAGCNKDSPTLCNLSAADLSLRSDAEHESTRTIIHRAIMDDAADVVEFLLKMGVDPNIHIFSFFLKPYIFT